VQDKSYTDIFVESTDEKTVHASDLHKEWDVIVPEIEWVTGDLNWDGLFKGNKLIGYICYAELGGVIDLKELLVGEEFRRKGYATLLLKSLVVTAKLMKAHKIVLETSEKHEEALDFYYDFGFRTEATLRKDKFRLTWYRLSYPV